METHTPKNKRIRYAILVVVFVASIFATAYASYRIGGNRAVTNSSKTLQGRINKYDLISRRVLIDNPNDAILNFTPLRKQLQAYLQANGLQDDSVYFEYLPTGVSIEEGENAEYVAASLMKLPLVMSLYKSADLGMVNLDTPVKLKAEWLDDRYGTLYQKGAGYSLTLRDAARYALEESDNTALYMIGSYVDETMKPDETSVNFLDMQLDEDATGKKALVTPQSYSSVLKCLYFSCYLPFDDSQELLTYLTKSVDKNRLTKLLPTDVKVAHKIGTYLTQSQSDCGIVYVPLRNYVFCAMVKTSETDGDRHIAALSKIVYDFVNGIQTTQ
jgi:beta-lactamase class A